MCFFWNNILKKTQTVKFGCYFHLANYVRTTIYCKYCVLYQCLTFLVTKLSRGCLNMSDTWTLLISSFFFFLWVYALFQWFKSNIFLCFCNVISKTGSVKISNFPCARSFVKHLVSRSGFSHLLTVSWSTQNPSLELF